jgi:hypothetical protein
MLIPVADMQMGMTDWHCFLFKIVGKAFYLKPSSTRNNIMTSNEMKTSSSDDVLMDAIKLIQSEMNGLKAELKSEMGSIKVQLETIDDRLSVFEKVTDRWVDTDPELTLH